MKLITTTAITLVAAVSAAPAPAQYGSAPATSSPQSISAASKEVPARSQTSSPKLKISREATPAVAALQQAVKANDTASIPAKVAAAQASAKTKDDHFAIGRLQLDAALKNNDLNSMGAAIDAIAASGYLEPSVTSGFYRDLGVRQFNSKQFAPAVAAFQKAAALTPNDPETLELLGQGQLGAGQAATASATLQRAIQVRTVAGQKPSEDIYRKAVQASFDSQSPAAVGLARQWVATYPSADSWRNSIAIYRNLNRPDVEGTLDLLRLEHAAGALTPGEYGLYAQAAAEQGNFNEAQAIMNAGIAAKVVDPADPRYRDIILGLKTKPMATAADLEAATKMAQNGTALLHIGDRYYAMGNYAKAVELYRLSMGKPGVDSSVANLHIGMALARAGDKAGAATALNAVTGQRSEIAKFWLAYIGQKS